MGSVSDCPCVYLSLRQPCNSYQKAHGFISFLFFFSFSLFYKASSYQSRCEYILCTAEMGVVSECRGLLLTCYVPLCSPDAFGPCTVLYRIVLYCTLCRSQHVRRDMPEECTYLPTNGNAALLRLTHLTSAHCSASHLASLSPGRRTQDARSRVLRRSYSVLGFA